jgi:hypothetical protein
METRDRALFSQTFKEYIIALGKREEFSKLKYLLINKILRDDSSIENLFLRELGISKILIYQNAISLLRNISGCEPLCELLVVSERNFGF